MSLEVIDIKCPGCGAPVSTANKICEYCGRPIVITSFNNIYQMTNQDVMKYKNAYQKTLEEFPESQEINLSSGMCLLKLNMYEKAYEKFEKVIESDIDNSEAYFWAAVSLLKGKRPFINIRATVDQAIELSNTARMLEDRGIYSYFIAYLKYDYYELKKLKIEPNYLEELQKSSNSITEQDIQMLAEVLKIENFDEKLKI